MIHTILINDNNTITKSVVGNILHRTSNVDTLRILVSPTYTDEYGDLQMSDCKCVMEIISPIGRTYTPKTLTPSKELYKSKLEYLLPIDIDITREGGNLEFKLTFTKLEMNSDGSFRERVRKTLSSTLQILPVEQWSDYISDANLDPIVQMLLSTQAQNEQTRVYAEMIMATKGDSLSYNDKTNELQLKSNGEPISSVILEDGNCEDGIPTVDIITIQTPADSGNIETNNVVEF